MNWQIKKLGELLELCDSGTWGEESSKGMPLLRSSNMQDGRLILDDLKLIDVPTRLKDRFTLREGDILITKSSGSEAHIGKSLYIDSEIDGQYGFSNFTQRLRPDRKLVEPFFLYFIISSPATRRKLLDSSRTTSGLRNLSIPILKSFEISTPPISIQRMVIKKLDAIRKLQNLNEIETTRTKELFEGLITKIFSSKSGGKYKISEIADGFQYGLSRAMNTNGGGVPILRINSIEDGTITDADLKHVEVSEEELSKYKVQLNDILFNRTNSYELVGKTGIFKLSGTFIFASYLIRLRAKGEVLPDYLNYFLNSPMGQAEIRRKAKRAVSQANVNAKELGSISMYVPAKSIQEKAIGQLNLVKQHLQILKAEKEKLVELFECLLSKELQT